MKQILLWGVFFCNQLLLAQPTKDIAAIKALCGCFEVSFNFVETFSNPLDRKLYKQSPLKKERTVEWVELVESSPSKLVLQHLLITDNQWVIKHWREDWLYENQDFFEYAGFNNWKYIAKHPTEVKGQWTQKVFQVDDSPRFEGSAPWVYTGNQTYWLNTTYAPLPRREFTSRKDYNILKRTNRYELTSEGYIHHQDNEKIVRNEVGSEYILAYEKGMNIYKRLKNSKCKPAQRWWQENKNYWAKVRKVWADTYAKQEEINFNENFSKNNALLELFKMDKESSETEIKELIQHSLH